MTAIDTDIPELGEVMLVDRIQGAIEDAFDEISASLCDVDYALDRVARACAIGEDTSFALERLTRQLGNLRLLVGDKGTGLKEFCGDTL